MEKSSIRKYNVNDSSNEKNFLMDFEKTEDFRPLKIFISYGHTEAAICNLICACLTQRGHIVWYDANDILPGNDWRASIINGIVNCDIFVAGLSRHYIRDNSVCLDELSIAIGVKKGNIKTILLEDENKVCIPGTVSNVQWFDLHDWKKRVLDKKNFNIWFEEKMKELIQTLEAKPDRDFNGQITNLKKCLHPNYSISKQAFLLEKQYSEREWLSYKVNTWLDAKDTGKLCVIYGTPGSGKSIFAANYMHYNARVAAAIFCESDRPQFNNTNNIIRVLSYQLACRLPEYRVMLNYLISDNSFYTMNESELFDYLIVDPLKKSYIGGHESMCILIDGLDECGDSECNIFAAVLKIYAERLPHWLKVLVFSRAESSVVASLCGSDIIILEEYDKEIRKDLTKYVSEKIKHCVLQDKLIDTIVHTIVEKSQGVFLYADLVTEALANGQILVTELDQIPPGLNSIFYHWFTRVFHSDKEFEEEYADVLGVIAASKEPLPKEELRLTFGWKNRKLTGFMRKLNGFFKESKNVFGKETIEFSHIYIREWLCSKSAGKFQCSPEDGKYELAQYYLKTYSEKGCNGLSEYGAMSIRECFSFAGIPLDSIEMDSDLFWKIMKLGFHCDDEMKERDALLCFQKAEALLGQNMNGNSPLNRISALHMCGVTYKITGDFKEAEICFKKELDLMQIEYSKRGVKELSNMLIAYEGYASFLNYIGRYTDSAGVFEDAVELINQNKVNDCDSQLYRNIYNIYSKAAINYRDLKLLEKSIQYFEKAINCLESISEPTDFDKENILTQLINKSLVEEDLGKWDGHLELYFKYLDFGKEKKSLIILAHANSFIGGEYNRLGNLEKSKKYHMESYRCYSELAMNSENILWIEKKFLSLTRLAAVEYQLTGDTEAYENAIIIGEAILEKNFLPYCLNALLVIYRDYVLRENIISHIAKAIKNIVLIAERVNLVESHLIKETMLTVFMSVFERADSIDLDKHSRILLYKHAIQCVSQFVDENYKLNLFEKMEDNLWFYFNCFSYLQSMELDDEILAVLQELVTRIKQIIVYYQHSEYESKIEAIAAALIELGRIHEKCTEYEKAYDSFFEAAMLQHSNMKSDWFSYRRVYFALNDCGRMKVMTGQIEKAITLFEDAVNCINKMFSQGVAGDEDDKNNLEMIQEIIKQLKNNESLE